MDAQRFDTLSRSVGAETSRRYMPRATVGGALGLLVGLGALGDGALAKKGFDGDRCKNNKNCGTGLECRGGKQKKRDNKGKCRHEDGCGKKGGACKNNGDCCGSRKCRDKKCRSQN